MSRISSESLFHFTKPEYLRSILENEFVPRWNIEEFTFKKNKYKVGIPMVCFCDIPLGQIHDHLKEYGQCGIGMKKVWAKANLLNPVFYIDSTSDASRLFYNTIETTFDLCRESEKDYMNEELSKVVIQNILQLNCYLKMINGQSTKTGKMKKFYDEREWRYVPEVVGSCCDYYIIPEDKCTKEYIELQNYKIKNIKLEFEPNDISYIIIEKEDDRMEIIETIESVKGKYSQNDRLVLKSKIVSSEQIIMDF